MASIDYSSVASATITNNGTADVQVQLYRVNLYETIKAGDSLKLAIESSEEAIYYVSLVDSERGIAVEIA